MHFHTIGNRCRCGHLTIPVSFHSRDSSGRVIEDGKGEAEYLRWLASDDKPDYVNPPVMAEVRGNAVVTKPEVVTESGNKTCTECGGAVTRRKVCNKCRQAAYRRRHEESA